MKIADANLILRYLLDDDEELSPKAAEIIEQNKLTIPNEIFAEIVYVLEKVYEVKREEINNTFLKSLYPILVSLSRASIISRGLILSVVTRQLSQKLGLFHSLTGMNSTPPKSPSFSYKS